MNTLDECGLSACRNCQGTNFGIYPQKVNTTATPDGRLRMHDLKIVFVVCCNECSETIKLLDEDQVNVQIK